MDRVLASNFSMQPAGNRLLGMFLASGCALNDRGLVKVRSYENDTTYVVSEEWQG